MPPVRTNRRHALQGLAALAREHEAKTGLEPR